MAPSTSNAMVDQAPQVKATGSVGAYRGLEIVGYDKEAEEHGKNGVAPAKHKHYLPQWDDTTYPPLVRFEHRDHGLDADTSYPDILPKGVIVDNLTPSTGTEITGVQISKLSPAGKDQLARFVAERKVVAFRDQDFADLPISEAVNYARYFGRLHIPPTFGTPTGHPEVQVVHRSVGDTTAHDFLKTRTSAIVWHADVSYEEQPPGTTILYGLEVPEVGGDTLFSNQVEAYNRLSPGFQQRLHGLKATHSGVEQLRASKASGGVCRREPVISEHPIVRTHPVTGEKSLYVNVQFTRAIVGFKQESDALLKFLYDHIAYGEDFHARVRWAPRTVIIWDNRVVSHSGVIDLKDGARRHLARLTPQAEVPYETPYVM